MKLPKLTGKEVAKAIKKIGFIHMRTRGSHLILKHEDGRITCIPHHQGKEIKPGTLNRIIKRELKITREEFLKLL